MVTGMERTPLEVSGWAHPTPTAWILHFAWPSNPVPMNGSRGGHHAHARKTRMVREHTYYRARAAHIPALGRCEAQLTWWVGTDRRRDVDNLARLEKPMFDALVDAHIVTDDTPDLMVKPRADICHWHQSSGIVTGPGFTLHIRQIVTEEEW